MTIRRSLSSALLGAAAPGIAWLLSFGTAHAQYMYIDVNGDGVNTAADLLSPTTGAIDIWLRTDTNRNGSPTICIQDNAQMHLNSYEISLHSSNPITWGAWTSNLPFPILLGEDRGPTDFYVFRGSGFYTPAGTYRLGTLALSNIGAETALSFLTASPIHPFGFTSFGTPCPGSDFDNTYKLGTDWFDADGVQAGCFESPPGNTFPVLTVAATASGTEGSAFQIAATATDADASNLLSVTTIGAPSSLALSTNVGFSPVTATLSGTLGYADAGSHVIRWTVGDGSCASDTASTVLTVANLDRVPIVTTPASVNATEGALVAFTASATDPDGEPIEGIGASPLPPGATFTPDDTRRSGTFEWTPDYEQAGVYTIQISAVSACRPVTISGVTHTICVTGGAPTVITVAEADPPPLLIAPTSWHGQESIPLQFQVSAMDPDGGPITSLTAAPLPSGATFTPEPDNTAGIFQWTPAYGQIGQYQVTFTASNALSVSKIVRISITMGPDRAPVITAPATVAGVEGSLTTFTATVSDPDGDAITTFTASPLPEGAAFTLNPAKTTGTFAWTPTLAQSGTYTVRLAAESACRAVGVSGEAACVPGSATTTITIADFVNRAPTAVTGGPYSGIVDVPIEFDGTGSSDPDGDALEYSWSFGDGDGASGALASHAYAAGGVFDVTLTVGDGQATNSASTTATVEGVLTAHAFLTNANRTIRLGSGKATWCALIEPVNDAYANSDVVLESLSLLYGGVRISALAGKSSVSGDKNGNGAEELTACFGKDDLRALFAGLPRGTTTVDVVLEAGLMNGGKIRAELAVTVSSPGGSLTSSVSPNPMNPEAVLTFTTSRDGWARVSLFDLQGRLVRRVMDQGSLNAGIHDVRVDGLREDGTRLPSGVYFYRVEAKEGAALGRLVIAK